MKVLHVGTEAHPLVKTGGLADVLGALPQAQQAQADVQARLLLPGWPAVVQGVSDVERLATLGPCYGAAKVQLLRATMPGSGVVVYVIDAPLLYGRPGNPYHNAAGHDWPDNLQRFGLLGWAAAQLAAGGLDPDWQPDLVHAHDWHAGMACAYLKAHAAAVPSVFTVHNLAYQGLFPHQDSALLGLSSRFMSSAGLEYHGQLSFMKAGLKFGDRLTTVSPTYAHEITTPEFGCGVEGVLRTRAADLSGILNGVDYGHWDPATDAALPARFDAQDLGGKAVCKAALQREFGLDARTDAPLIGIVSRLSEQKGLDLALAALPALRAEGVQLAILGSGDAPLERAFADAAAAHPGQVGVHIGYDETLAHRVIAGADLILVPSRFEPCGLTQLYGMRYGTLPLVRRVGGLADTVDDASGFIFEAADSSSLIEAARRAVLTLREPARWRAMQQTAMARDHSWSAAAARYLALYRSLMA